MKHLKKCIIPLLLVFGVVAGYGSEFEAEKEAVRLAALDYIEGAHSGDAARIERGCHVEMNKVTVIKAPGFGTECLNRAGYTRLLELVRAGAVNLPEDQRNIEIKIYAIREGLAAVRVRSRMFCDYLQLARIDGRWKLINALWTRLPKSGEELPNQDMEAEKTAIQTAALDYIEGAFSGNGDRMASAVHPGLNKVIPVLHPKTQKTMLNYSTASLLVAWTASGGGKLAEDQRDISYRLHEMFGNIAMAEVISSRYIDYLQLAKINDRWRIVNVLWKMNPEFTR